MSEYVLQVGAKGFDRLQFLNDVFGVHSKDFLTRAGLCSGATVLELGCGSGSMTVWLAQVVGGRGKVIAVDASRKQIEIAQLAAANAEATNIDFVCSTVAELEIPSESVDLIYSRFLLMHLNNPVQTLAKARIALRQGGVIACEEPHSSSLATEPQNDTIEQLNRLFVKLGKLQGLDFDIGNKLFQLVRSAGYSDLHCCFIQPVISMAKAAEFVRMGATEIAPFAVRCGLTSEIETQHVFEELERCEFGEDSFYAFPRQAQVFARK